MSFRFRNKKGEIDIEEWISLVGDVGFPILILAAFYLLIRFEKKLDNLTKIVSKMADMMENRKE